MPPSQRLGGQIQSGPGNSSSLQGSSGPGPDCIHGEVGTQGVVVRRDPSKLGELDLPNQPWDKVVGSEPGHLAQVHGGVLHEVEVLAGVPPVQVLRVPPAPPVQDLVKM